MVRATSLYKPIHQVYYCKIEERGQAEKEVSGVHSVRHVEAMSDKYVTVLIIQWIQSSSNIDDCFLDDENTT